MLSVVKARAEHGAIGLEERPRPDPAPNEVLVEVSHAGLCGSDAGIFRYDDAYRIMQLPRVIGHEYSGTVLKVGKNVDSLQPGNRVVDRVIRDCGNCEMCIVGTTNVCADSELTGVTVDGGWRPYADVSADALQIIPTDLSLREAALAEPTAVAARAVLEHSRVTPGDQVLVQGPGPIGLLSAQIARSAGAEVLITGVGADENTRLPVARKLGFEAVNVEGISHDELRQEYSSNNGFHIVFDATGHPSGVESATTVVRKGGQVVLIGVPDQFKFDFTRLIRAELNIQATYGSTDRDFHHAFRLLRSGVVDIDPLIDTSFSLSKPTAAFQAFLEKETIKPLFNLDELR